MIRTYCNTFAARLAGFRIDNCYAVYNMAAAIGEIMGVAAEEGGRRVAFVKCGGDCEKAKENYVYSGVEECSVMPFVPNGGAKTCTYGCLGYGSCVKACPFDAIHVVNGVAVVDKKKCSGRYVQYYFLL